MEYIQKIEKELKRNDITAKKMLLELGYADSLISQWKKGSEPSAIKLRRIANYLGLSMDYLFTNENEVKNEKENEKMEYEFNRELVEKGLKALFYAEVQIKLISGDIKIIKVLDENGRIPDSLSEITGISIKKLKSFLELKDIPTREEFKRILEKAGSGTPQLKNYIAANTDCIALLNHLYDCGHFSETESDKFESIDKRLSNIEKFMMSKFDGEFSKEIDA